MHIVQVNHMFLDGGGREEHVFQVSKNLAEKGHIVTVVTSDYSPTGEFNIKRKADKVSGIKIVTLKGFPTSVPPGRIQIPDLVDFLVDYKADIVHAHGMGEQPVEDSFLASKINRIPFVFTHHFAPYQHYSKLNAESIWRTLFQYQIPNIMRGADKIISVSPDEKEDIIKVTKYTGDSIEIVPNGFEREPEKITKESIANTFKKYGIPEGRTYVVFVGNLTNPRKGALEAIQAFKMALEKNQNLHLIMIGSFDTRVNIPGRSIQVTKLLERLARARHVSVVGRVSNADKFTLLAGSHMFISPTYYEAFGIALAEASYSKLPVITTDAGGCRFVIRKKIDGILIKSQEDVESFANAIVDLAADPEKRKRMGESGHQHVKSFTWEKTASKLEFIYKRLVSKYNSL